MVFLELTGLQQREVVDGGGRFFGVLKQSSVVWLVFGKQERVQHQQDVSIKKIDKDFYGLNLQNGAMNTSFAAISSSVGFHPMLSFIAMTGPPL